MAEEGPSRGGVNVDLRQRREFERDLIVERTVAGIQAAKARGVTVGRPRSMSREQVQHAKALVNGGEPRRKVARLFRVSPSTLYRVLAV